jgi:chemotaxis protein MotB
VAKKKGGGPPQKDKSERWLLTYSDMITLLLALFVVLFAISRVDEEKYQQVAAGLAEGFNVPLPHSAPSGGIVPGGSIAGAGGSSAGEPAVLFSFGQGLTQDLHTYALREDLGEEIAVRYESDAVVVTLSGTVGFASGTANLRPAARSALEVVAARLRTASQRPLVRVEGHTDSVLPQTPEFPTNWELSAARAAAVARYLAGTGIEPDRLAAVGFADNRPVGDNATAEGRGQNRRVELWIMPSPTPAASAAAPATAAAPAQATPPARAATAPQPGQATARPATDTRSAH